jgi:hypothetical protein
VDSAGRGNRRKSIWNGVWNTDKVSFEVRMKSP